VEAIAALLTLFFHILIFPGLLFLFVFGLAAEFFDRKFYARMQNRIGPPWYQTLADFIKLIGKEDMIPAAADKVIFHLMPIFAVTAAVTAFMYVPLWSETGIYAFNGDVVVVLYLLTIPTLTFFLGGWYSRSVYSMLGAARSLIQLFAYEVPLFMCILAAAMLADSWSFKGIVEFYSSHPGYWMFNILGLCIALISLLGKLEKTPFDIPEAETEIVAGTFTEYSGKLLAFFKVALNIELVVGASVLAAVFLPFGYGLPLFGGIVMYFIKVLFIIFLVSLAHSVLARLRIDQMINLCWKVFAPLAFLQVFINLLVKGLLLK